MFNKVSKTIGLLRKLQEVLPRPPWTTPCKSFARPHLGHGVIMYNQVYKVSFQQKLESIQYNSALAITGAIRGPVREMLYHELGFESLERRLWYRDFCAYFKVKCNYFKNSFFSLTVIELNKMDQNIRNSESFTGFIMRNILKFIRFSENSVFFCNNPKGIQLLTRLRLGVSHLQEHEFKHNFHLYTNERLALLSVIRGIDNNVLELGDPSILDGTIEFLLETKVIDERFFKIKIKRRTPRGTE